MRWFLCAFACFVGTGLGGCASKPTGLKNQDNVGEKIVGAWEVVKSGTYTPEGAIWEFARDGKLKVTTTIDDKATTTEWSYTLAGDKLGMVGPEAATETLTIKKLSDTELITEGTTEQTGIVTGFHYTSSIPVKSVLISKPLRGGQKNFELVVGDKSFALEAGKRFFFTSVFPEGVGGFTIRGINESEKLVYEPGEIERTRTARPFTNRPLGHHHRGSFPTGMSFVKEGKADVKMVPILKQYPTEYRRKAS
jgi:uncharacterized protein (TIGR03066 family)